MENLPLPSTLEQYLDKNIFMFILHHHVNTYQYIMQMGICIQVFGESGKKWDVIVQYCATIYHYATPCIGHNTLHITHINLI